MRSSAPLFSAFCVLLEQPVNRRTRPTNQISFLICELFQSSAALLIDTFLKSVGARCAGRGYFCSVIKLALTAMLMSSIQGVQGQELSVSQTQIKPNSRVVVTGKGFDPKVGIYLAFCKIPEYGQMPTPCGGGVNMSGKSKSSIWISNNAPAYGKGLAVKFGKNGSFKQTLRLSPMINDVDCRKVRCAITVRADHTRSDNRNYDLFIPIKFTGK